MFSRYALVFTHLNLALTLDVSQNNADTLSELRALSKIIQDSINVIETTTAAKDLQFPSSRTPLTMESEAARMLPEVEGACALIVAATAQLAFAVRSPLQSVITVALQVCFLHIVFM